MLYHRRGKSLQPVLPKSMQYRVLEENHSGKTGGHFGIQKTYEKLKLRVYWKRMFKDVQHFVRACHECQLRKPYPKPKTGLMIPITVSTTPFKDISLDLLEMPISDSGFRYVVVINDRFTKFARAEAIKTCTSSKIKTALYESWILLFGVPRTLITDQGPNLMSEEFQSFLHKFNIKHQPTTPYHPQSDGQTERFNAYLGDTLAIYARDNPKLWDSYLKECLFAYNSTPHRSSKLSPFYLAFGIEARLPFENELDIQPSWIEVEDRFEALKRARLKAKEAIDKSQTINKEIYDRSRVDCGFDVDDYVVLKIPRLIKGKSKKFMNRYKGPYIITRKLSPVTYEIMNLRGRRSHKIIHGTRLKPYYKRCDEPSSSFESSAHDNTPYDDLGALLDD